MPESNTSNADQPAVTSSMVISHNNNHEEPAIHRTGSGGGGSGGVAPNPHHHHQQQHQQTMAPQMFPQHASNYLPLYQNKHPMSGPYNGVMMDGGSHEKETVCIYVPNSMVGAIIGKSGLAIKEMISNSGASIKVATALPLVETAPKPEPEPESNSSSAPPQDLAVEGCSSDEKATTEDKCPPESEQESQNNVLKTPKTRHPTNSSSSGNHMRKVTIVGTAESQWSAQYMIYRKVALESMGSDVSLTAEIQVPSHLAGKIIGKSGATIKRLQKQTRTVIRLTDCRPPESIDNDKEQQQQQHQGDSRVQITGDFNGSQLAQRHIRALIRDSLFPTKSRSGFYPDFNMSMNAMNQPPYLFNNIPLPYMPGPNAQYPISSGIVNSHTNHGGHAISRNMSGGSHHSHQMYPDTPNYFPLYPNKPTMSGYNGTMTDGGHEKEIVCIYVPNSMVGAIIGKSGLAIKEMISNSGASIKVATALPLVETAPKPEPEPESNSSSAPPQDLAVEGCSSDEKATTEDKCPPESEQESQNNASKMPPKTRNPQNSPSTSNHIRKVTIVGTPDSQWSAQYMIYRKVALESMGSDVSLTAEIQVPAHLAGRIIGKSGTTIKRLQKQTRTVIRLTDCRQTGLPENDNKSESKNEIETNDDRDNGSEKELKQQQPPVDSCVQITGDFNGSQLAQRQIRNLIKQSVPLKIEVRLFSKS